jgi:WD repeat and SOF domain-containing protein 1
MSLFGQTKRHVPAAKNARRSPLPIFAGVDHEKKYDLSAPFSQSTSRYFTTVYLPLPSFFSRSPTSDHLPNGNGYSPRGYGSKSQQRRYARLCVPIPPRIYARLPRLNTPLRIVFSLLLALGLVFVLLGFRHRGPRGNTWTPPFTDPDTLVLAPEEVAMIWEWEVLSGHYPNIQSRE